MAISKKIQSTELLIAAHIGDNANGNPIKKDFVFKPINPDCPIQIVFNHAKALKTLVKFPALGYFLREKHQLMDTEA